MKSKLWRGILVDEGLKDTWLSRLNCLPEWNLDSICCGHSYDDTEEDWNIKNFAGCPTPNFDMYSTHQNAMEVSLKIKEVLKSIPDTLVYTRWERPDGGFVYNGKFIGRREEYSKIFVGVDSEIENTKENEAVLDLWWEKVLYELETLLWSLSE